MHTDPSHGSVPLGTPSHPIADFTENQVRTIVESDLLDSMARPLQTWLRTAFSSPEGKRTKDLLNGTWLGHPLHPAITDLPIGAWATASILDLLSATTGRDFDRGAQAAVGIGILGAVGAAATGFADWADATSRGQRRVGLMHAALNTAALGLQVASWFNRRSGGESGPTLSALGFLTASVAGYLGGDLAFRQGTQVSRNAWSEGPREFTPAMAESELSPEQPVRAEVNGSAVMVVKHQNEIFALDDVCGHAGCPLSKGHLQGDAIVCPCHGSTFRLRDGEVLHGPAVYNQPVFDVRVEEGQVEVRRRSDRR